MHRSNQPSAALERLLRIQNKNDYVYEMMGSLYQYNLLDASKAETCYLNSIEASDQEIAYWEKSVHDLAEGKLTEGKYYPELLTQVLDLNHQKIRVTQRKKGLTSLSLAILYVESLDAPNKAEELYSSILSIGTTNTIYFLADFLFRQRIKPDLAYEAVCKSANREAKLSYLSLKAKIELWQGNLAESLQTAEYFLSDMDFILTNGKLHQEYIMMLIAMGQHAYVLSYFKKDIPDHASWGKGKFKDVCKPLYFAQLYFLKDKQVMESLRMGGELRDTVNEIIKRIMDLQQLYVTN